MRFLFKIGLLVLVASWFLPGGPQDDGSESAAPSSLALFYGARQAIDDLSGFCDRAPAACSAGRETILYAGERIGATIAYAASLAQERIAAPSDAAPDAVADEAIAEETVPAEPARALAASDLPVPRPYSPPRLAAGTADPAIARP